MRSALIALAAAAALALPAAAHSATYTVRACAGPSGTGVNHLFAPYGGAPRDCDFGNGLHAPLAAPVPAGGSAGFVMTAPAGTSIAGYSVTYGVDWAGPVGGEWLSAIDGNDGVTLSGPSLPSGTFSRWGPNPVTRSGLALHELRLRAGCGSRPCLSDSVHPWWNDVRVDLADGSEPTVSGGFGRSGWLRGMQTLGYSAADNSGIARTRLDVDGSLQHDDSRTCDYSRVVACSDVTDGGYPVDTTRLADGTHSFTVEARDATDANAALLRGSFRVDNTPPVTTAAGQGGPGAVHPGPVTLTLAASDRTSGMGAADDGEPVTSGGHIAYAVDGGALHRTGGDHAEAELRDEGTHTVTFRAYDVAGNVSADRVLTVKIGMAGESLRTQGAGFSDRATNPGSTFTAARTFAETCPGEVDLSTSRDSWLDQTDPDGANASSGSLEVRASAARALLAFDLPAAARCHVAHAELRVHATAAGGGTLSAYRIASPWDDGTTWATRPGTAGMGANAPAAPGWISFDVTTQAREMYAYGADGFLLRGADATLVSSEGDPARRPRLLVSYE